MSTFIAGVRSIDRVSAGFTTPQGRCGYQAIGIYRQSKTARALAGRVSAPRDKGLHSAEGHDRKRLEVIGRL